MYYRTLSRIYTCGEYTNRYYSCKGSLTTNTGRSKAVNQRRSDNTVAKGT